MVDAITLVNDLTSRGGMLSILKEYLSRLDKLAERATDVWRRAFPGSTVVINRRYIGRFWALFRAIYVRARPQRRAQLSPLLEEYRKIFEEYLNLTKNISVSDIEGLVQSGERIYGYPKTNYRLFLYNLHRWIRDVFLYFSTRDARSAIPDIYNFHDKMIHIIIDVSTEYTAGKPPGSFEFVLSCFIHIENFVHKSSESYEPYGIVPVAIAYLLEVLERLVEREAYLIVYPGYAMGSWETNYYILPLVSSEELVAASTAKEVIRIMASQMGIDIKDDYAELKTITQEFPAYFIIYDHHRGVVRREREATLPWDFLGLSVEDIVERFR